MGESSPGRTGPLVSCSMIVRDEAHNLEACFAAARPLVDEWIVVDTGSDDGTPDLAAKLGATVMHEPWCDDFSYSRNKSFEHATGTWTIWLDGDDRLEGAEALRRHLEADPEVDVVCLLVESLLPKASPGQGSVERFWQPRIFRTSKNVRFRYPVHEAPSLDGLRVATAPAKVRHLGYADPATLVAKAERTLDLLRPLSEDDPHRLHYEMRSMVVLQDWKGVKTRAEKLLEAAGPRAPDIFQLGALAALMLGEPVEAARLLVDGLSHWPDHPDLFHGLLGVGGVGYLGAVARVRANPTGFRGLLTTLDMDDSTAKGLVAAGLLAPEAVGDVLRNRTGRPHVGAAVSERVVGGAAPAETRDAPQGARGGPDPARGVGNGPPGRKRTCPQA